MSSLKFFLLNFKTIIHFQETDSNEELPPDLKIKLRELAEARAIKGIKFKEPQERVSIKEAQKPISRSKVNIYLISFLAFSYFSL